MSVEKLTSSVANSGFSKSFNKFSQNFGKSFGNFLERHPIADGFVKKIEPTGANNAFAIMTGLMVGNVIVPRVLTAAKRNPDDKQATKDEIVEILFRDCQTVAIILFLLKILNAAIATAVTKKSGLPMTNKAFEPVFMNKDKGLEGLKLKTQAFFKNPTEKLATIGKNFLDLIHPTGGVYALTNNEFVSRYSNVASIEDVKKIFDEIGEKGGKPEKIFKEVMDNLIERQEARIKSDKGTGFDTKEAAQKAKKVLEALKDLKEKKFEGFRKSYDKLDDIYGTDISKNIKDSFDVFFNEKDGKKDNPLVWKAKIMNGALRTGALAFESGYLGFGLPALNQRRLEKKYLGKKKEENYQTNYQAVLGTKKQSYSPILIDKSMKPQEIRVFKEFVKR